MIYINLCSLMFILFIVTFVYYISCLKILDTNVAVQLDTLNIRMYVLGYYFVSISVYLVIIPLILFTQHYNAFEVGGIMLTGLTCLLIGVRRVHKVELCKEHLESLRKKGEIHRHQNKTVILKYKRFAGFVGIITLGFFIWAVRTPAFHTYVGFAIQVAVGMLILGQVMCRVIMQVQSDELEIRECIAKREQEQSRDTSETTTEE